MKHYVGVFQPLEAGGWRALFPDVPACHVEEPSLDLAILLGEDAGSDQREQVGPSTGAPRSDGYKRGRWLGFSQQRQLARLRRHHDSSPSLG